MSLVEFHAVFVQYPEDGTASTGTADHPDVVDGVTIVVHRDDGAFTLLLRLGNFCLGANIDVALQTLDVDGCSAKCHCLFGERANHLEHPFSCFCCFDGKLNSFRL